MRVVCVNAPGLYPVIAVPHDSDPDDGCDVDLFTSEGGFESHGESPLDIVEEYRKPQTLRLWVHQESTKSVYPHEDGDSVHSWEARGFVSRLFKEVT